ncbi:MAG TPA: hypothetical protein VGD00_03760 [Solirubrobacteraceae bacterium]
MALEDQRPDGIAGGGAEDRERARQLAGPPGDIEADQRDDAGKADEHAEHAQLRGPLSAGEAQRQQRDHQRHGGNQDRGQRRRQALLTVCDQREWDRDLDQPVRGDPAHAPGE